MRMSGTDMQRAFTLVELLVVVAIISVLAGLLLPVLRNAQASAQEASCLINLRQLGVATVLYEDENKGYLPFGWVAGGTYSGLADVANPAWYCKVWPYISGEDAFNFYLLTPAPGYRSVFHCPSLATSGVSLRGAWYAPGRHIIERTPTSYLDYVQGRRANAIKKPSARLWLHDVHPAYNAYGMHHNDSPVNATISLTDNYNNPSGVSYMACRHDGRAGGLFFDGHVESVFYGRLYDSQIGTGKDYNTGRGLFDYFK